MVQPIALGSCASCAAQTNGKPRCARCHTLYCSRACQKTHWASGAHKKDCKGLARARHDTNIEAQSRALARVAHTSGGAPDDARCLCCFDGDEVTEPLVRGCGCRGSSGWSHATCRIKTAEAARAPPAPAPHFAAWLYCKMCKQPFTGLLQLRLAIELWAKHARALETDEARLEAACEYAAALGDAGEHAEAVRLEQGVLDVRTRTLGPEHCNTLSSAVNLGVSLVHLGECGEAVTLLRTTLAVQTRTLGVDDEGALLTESHLAGALIGLGEHAEAEALGRGTLEKRRRVLGQDHRETLATSGNLAASLSAQGKHAEAVEIEREILVHKTRLFGAKHEDTLASAFKLAVSLSFCGRKAESQQLFRDMLL